MMKRLRKDENDVCNDEWKEWTALEQRYNKDAWFTYLVYETTRFQEQSHI